MEAKPSLESIILQIVMDSPEIADHFDRIAEAKYQKLSHEKRLTPDEMAEAYGVSRSTIDRLTAQELSKLGWEKIYIASLPRFQRIAEIEVSLESLKKISQK